MICHCLNTYDDKEHTHLGQSWMALLVRNNVEIDPKLDPL